jgi:preprotein translocase subunit Sec61beta
MDLSPQCPLGLVLVAAAVAVVVALAQLLQGAMMGQQTCS